jgi:DNA-directed RNA polymerase II subunit RPB1
MTSKEQLKVIDHIEFNILGNEEIQRMTVFDRNHIGIDSHESYENNEPKKGGPVDSRLGVVDLYRVCATCNLDATLCPGHFGHIHMTEPVFNTCYMQFIRKILTCICTRCSKLLIYSTEQELNSILKNKQLGKLKLTDIRNISKDIKICKKGDYGCGATVPKITLLMKKSSSIINITAERKLISEDDSQKKSVIQILTPEIIHEIFSNISDIDATILGINPNQSRPEMMIIKYFPVPPIQIRPSAKVDFISSGIIHDGLTSLLTKIAKLNLRLKKHKETNESLSKFDNYFYMLQANVAVFQNSNNIMPPKDNQKMQPTRSIAGRLNGKEGIIRSNLMGKRVDFSARSVITADASIGTGYLRVPLKIAMHITFPETATRENIHILLTMVRNGCFKYPGANYVEPYISNSNNKINIDLRYRNNDIILNVGDIVHRHLVSGDVVLFNRQPSLHKVSMLSHIVHVIENENIYSFGINTASTKPYNADFDGDEMNLYMGQGYQSVCETYYISRVKNQIISPTYSAVIVEVKQDGLIGNYLLSISNAKFKKNVAMNLLSGINNCDINLSKNEYTGKEIISTIIPKRTFVTSSKCEIYDGELINGYISNSAFSGHNNITANIFHNVSVEKALEFIDNVQLLAVNFNIYYGSTISFGDVIISNDAKKSIYDKIFSDCVKISHVITELENNPYKAPYDIIEQALHSDIDSIRQTIDEIVKKNLSKNNNFVTITTSGAKGAGRNLGQMIGVIGLQSVEGKRIKMKINNRTLPVFCQYDETPISRGFINNSFLDGVDSTAFFFCNMASREGVIDTAIKTSESGYLQRKIVKGLEDAKICYDNTVRTANGTILQFVYGGNGIDTVKQCVRQLHLVSMRDDEVRNNICFTDTELQKYNVSTKLNNDYFDKLIKMRNELRYGHVKSTFSLITVPDTYTFPIDIYTIILQYKNSKVNGNILTVDNVLDGITRIYNDTFVLINTKDTHIASDEILSKSLFEIILTSILSPKKCICEYKLNSTQFNNMCDCIISKFNSSLAYAGEMVGTIAGQSLGEPLTQMSVVGNSLITIFDKMNNKYIDATIGEFIDQLLHNNKNNIINLGKNGVELSINSIYVIQSLNNHDDVEWSYITHVSKHPANGPLMSIQTKNNCYAETTQSHSYLTKTGLISIVPIRGDELKIGSIVPVLKSCVTGDYIIPFAYNEVKCVNNEIYNSTCVNIMINLDVTEQPNNGVLLSKLTNFIENAKTYTTKSLHSLENLICKDVVWDEIIDIQYFDSDQYVYDFTVNNNNNFLINNSIIVHNTLNTFHHAGIGSLGSASLGVPRIKELLSFSKNMKGSQITIYFTDEYKHDLDKVELILSNVRCTLFKDVIDRYEIYYEPDIDAPNNLTEKDNVRHGFYNKNKITHIMPWVIRVQLNKEAMLSRNIRLIDLKAKLSDYWEKRNVNMRGSRKHERQIYKLISNVSIISNNESNDILAMHIRMTITSFNFKHIIYFLEEILGNVVLKGLSRITLAVIDEINIQCQQTGDKKKEYIIRAMGNNLTDFRYIRGIDLNKTTSNDMPIIHNTYGIEGVRSSLFYEFSNIYSSNINYHHMSLLIDVMTNKGYPISIDRHGMSKLDCDPLIKASFEKTVDQFTNAAVFGERDYMNGVSSRIMAGLIINGGTGLPRTYINTDMISKFAKKDDIDDDLINRRQNNNNMFKDIVNNSDNYSAYIPFNN